MGGGDPAGAPGFQVLGDPLALLLRFAEPRPSAPSDSLPGQSHGTAVGRELVEKRIGRRMVRLPRIAQYARHAGKQHEEVEVAVPGRPVQVPGSDHLGP